MYYDTNKVMMMNKCTSSAGRFNGHSSAPEQYRGHCPMQHVQGYSGSYWMLASGNYLLRIALVATRATANEMTMKKMYQKDWPF
jgi:hypothetical protein